VTDIPKKEPLTDEQAKAKAKLLYLNSKTVRFKDISDRVGRPIEQLKEWHSQERWLDERRELQEQKMKALGLMTPDEFENQLKQIAQALLVHVYDQVKDSQTMRHCTVREIGGYMKMVTDLEKMVSRKGRRR
jgi:uncharacterized protein YcbK (DUF882 family)